MAIFQRARSQEQRDIRRKSILDAAAAMLLEMPAAAVTLSELSRRVGLAKSNVLRYFESREAVLLDLLDDAAREWLANQAPHVTAKVEGVVPVGQRIDVVSESLANGFAAEPVLSDLLSVQAAILERNVSTQLAMRYRKGVLTSVSGLASLLSSVLPELDEGHSFDAAKTLILLVRSIWTESNPADAMKAAIAQDPSLCMRNSFAVELKNAFEVVLAGHIALQHNTLP
ncbi:TetR family transcriptional regulator [Enhygromyxa salina]|nr:TetR family transcriptional regulator [Enhygromyxa salina]